MRHRIPPSLRALGRLAGLSAATLTALAACTSPDTGTIVDPSEADPTGEAGADERYDPPLSFGSPIVDADVEAYFVDGDLLYTLDATDPNGAREDSITAWSIETGEIVNTAFVGDIASRIAEYGNQDAMFGWIDDRVVLVHSFVSTETDPEAGGELSVVWVSVLDAEDGSVLWANGLGDTAKSIVDGGSLEIRSVGSDHVVVSVREEDGSEGFIWRADDGERIGLDFDVMPVLEHSGIVAGERRARDADSPIVAYDLESGTELWTAEVGLNDSWRLADLGDGLLAVYEHVYEFESELQEAGGMPESITQTTRVLDAATGAEVIATETETETEVECLYDGFELVACHDQEERAYLESFEVATGESVWSSHRTSVDWEMPNTLGAFSNGALYMSDTYDDSAAALDARTGEFLTDLPAALTEVGPGYGVAVEEWWGSSPELALYPEHIDRGGSLGVEITDPPLAADSEGALVVGFAPDSPAEEAGLEEGDIITVINDTLVYSAQDLADLMALFAPGETVQVWFDRDGEQETVEVTLEEK